MQYIGANRTLAMEPPYGKWLSPTTGLKALVTDVVARPILLVGQELSD
jgi:hypothetical protein